MPKAKKASGTTTSDSDGETISFSSDNVAMFIDKITTNFTASFNNCVEKLVSAIERKVDQRIDCQAAEIFELHKKIEALERQNKNMDTVNSQLNEKINQLTSKLDTMAEG